MKTALITGAAGGIGQSTVQKFLDNNIRVIGLDIQNSDRTQNTQYSEHIHDTRDTNLNQLSETLGPIDYLITIAGRAYPGETTIPKATELPNLEMFQNSLELNLTGTYNTLLAFLPNLKQTKGDRSITFISSINAIQGYGLPAYSAAKAGLISLATTLSEPLGNLGIRVNAILPGTTPTPRTIEQWAHHENHWDDLKQQSTLNKLATTNEIADAIYAIGITLTHVTGTHLIVDGGETAKR
jgi:NAD(P)-dependent dehydrogenase (short-subunit alcohol dehydrogenase family)